MSVRRLVRCVLFQILGLRVERRVVDGKQSGRLSRRGESQKKLPRTIWVFCQQVVGKT